MKKYLLICISLVTVDCIMAQAKLLPVHVPKFKKDTFNIVKFGAKADGVFLNTKAINDAVSACSKNGGNGDVWLAVKKDKLTETQWKKKLASGGILSDDKKHGILLHPHLKGLTLKMWVY